MTQLIFEILKKVYLLKLIYRANNLVLTNRLENQVFLKQKLDKEKLVQHLKNPTGKFLHRKDEISNKFNIKKDKINQIEELFSGNLQDREKAFQ